MTSPFDDQPHVLIALSHPQEDEPGGQPSQVFGPFPNRRTADEVLVMIAHYSEQEYEIHRLIPPFERREVPF